MTHRNVEINFLGELVEHKQKGERFQLNAILDVSVHLDNDVVCGEPDLILDIILLINRISNGEV